MQDYAAQDIRNVIAFVEEHTGQHWDWSHYFECAKRVNDATRNRLAWLEMNSTPFPQFVGAPFSLYNDTNYMGNCGRSEKFPPIDRKIMRYAERGSRARRMMAKEYRHRAIVWGVQPQYCIDMLNWMVHCWGIVPLTDMLSLVNTRMIADTDTPENRKQAFYDMAWLNENMIMRNRTHGGYRVLVDELWEFCETMHAETVVLLSHKKADSYIHIDVEFGEGEGKIPVDSIAKRAEAYKPKEKVTYKMIKEYIEAKYGFKVHTAYIAEVKRNLGLPMYDAPNAVEELKQPRKHPTPEKVEAIKDALRYFAVI